MKTSLLLIFDQYIVRAFVLMINIFVIGLGKILRIDHSLDKPFKRIAVSKYKGMGSIVQATDLLCSLRMKYPNARITFISTTTNRGLLEQLHPLIDNTIFLDDSSLVKLVTSFPVFILRLIRDRYEVFMDLEIYSDSASLISLLSMAKNRIGYYLRSSHYRRGIYTHMLYFNNTTPIHQNYRQMGRLLGAEDLDRNLLQATPLMKIRTRLIIEKYIVINPNASDLRIERRWPMGNYVELIDRIHSTSKAKIVIIGGKNEKDYCQAIYDKLSATERVENWAGETNLDGLFNLIQNCEVMISNDSGPMHLSFLYDKKTIALFGPCHPSHYGVSNANVRIHYVPLYCSPCVHDFHTAPCKGNNVCMQQIKITDVYNSFVSLSNGEQPSIHSLPIVYMLDDGVLGRYDTA